MRFNFFLILGFLLISQCFQANAQVADFTTTKGDVYKGCAPFDIEFVNKSTGGTTDYIWDFGDGRSSSLANPRNTYSKPGKYIITLIAKKGSASSPPKKQPVEIFANPNVDFTTSSARTGCNGLSVQFQDSSINPGGAAIATWKWTFDDGAESPMQTPPPHAYAAPNKYNVALTIIDANGCKSSITKPSYVITVNPPSTSFTTDKSTSACAPPLKLVFTNTSTAGLKYLWDYGQGSKSTSKDSTITYTKNGTFHVKLTATDQYGCSQIYTQDVNINKPKADFTLLGGIDTSCKKVTFVDKSTGGSLSWDYGDGTPAGTSLKHTYATGGTYSVKMTVIAGGCQHDTTKKIFIEDPKADYSRTPSYSCTQPYVVTFTDKSKDAAQWKWVFSNKQISKLQNPVIKFIQDTFEYSRNRQMIFTDSLYVISKHGCRDSVARVKNDTLFRPNAIFWVDKAQGCVGAPMNVTFTDSSSSEFPITNYTWDFGDGSPRVNGLSKKVSHQYNTAGNYKTRLIISNSKGCIDTSYYIFIKVGNVPTPNFSMSATTTCLKTPVTFTDLTPASNKVDRWHYTADGTYMSACPNDKGPITWSFDSDSLGVRNVTLTVESNGCPASITKTITVKGPWAKANESLICSKPFDRGFAIDKNDVTSWSWNFGDGSAIDNSSNPNPQHTYSKTGNFNVILTSKNTNGCPDYRDTVFVKIREIKAKIGGDTAFCSAINKLFDASKSVDVFENCNTGYRWDFGDTTRPEIASSPLMNHTFKHTGLRHIRLIVKDVNGCKDTALQDVLVNRVKANYLLDKKPICLPSTVTLKSLSTGDTTLTKWFWNIESIPGQISGANPDVLFTKLPATDKDKKFKVTLTVIDILGCTDTLTKYIQPSLPDSTFSISRTTFCSHATDIKFTANETGVKSTFKWSFGDGRDTTVKNPFHIYDTSGTYTTVLTVTDSIGCVYTYKKSNINVRNHPVAKFISDPDKNKEVLCYPLPIKFTDRSLYSTIRTWDIGTGKPVNPDSTASTTYSDRGEYIVKLTVNNDGDCPASIQDTFPVVGPVANLSITKDHICLGELVEFKVDPNKIEDVLSFKMVFGDGTDTLGNAPVPSRFTHNYTFKPPLGSTKASLVVYTLKNQNVSGCSYSYDKDVFIDQTIANFFRNDEIDTTVCLGTPIEIKNKSVDANSFTWDIGEGTKINAPEINASQSYTYTAAKTYNIKLVAKNTVSLTLCKDSIIKQVRVDPLPIATVTGEGVICPPDAARQELQFLAKGGAQYAWYPKTGLSDSSIANPIAKPSSTTLYSVDVIDTNNCFATKTVNAVVLVPVPVVNIDTTIVIGEELDLNLNIGPGYKYNWDPSEYLNCTDCPIPHGLILKDKLYTVLRSDTGKCYSSTSTYNVIVKPLTSIDVPTAFTPNGDKNNDVIYLKGWGIKKLIEFKIYNRWGQLMFETNDINEGWDGYYNGELQNTETYVYHASVETWVPGRNLSKKGTINLLK